IFLEQSDFAGIQLSQICYGFTIVLFFKCMGCLLWPKHGRERNYPLAAYTFILFGLGTIFTAMNVRLMQLSFINNREFPGGPEAYSSSMFNTWRGLVPNASFIVANWMADGLLLFRCKVIWQGHQWILALPILLYLADISVAIIYLYQVSQPNATLFTKSAVDFGLPYFSLTTTLNILLTLLISIRLLVHHRRMVRAQTNQSWKGLSYIPIISMLVESSAIYAIFSILFIGLYAAGSSAAYIFLPVLSQTQIIAPLLIISRVATRKAWSTVDSRSANAIKRPWSASGPASGSTTTKVDIYPLEPSNQSGDLVHATSLNKDAEV
ncbi:hypothetical protein VNI00_001391, partial [Paramarasmius palmivorus]